MGKHDLSVAEKNELAHFLISNSKDMKINHGQVKVVAEKYGISRRVVHYICNQANEQLRQGNSISFTNKKLGMPHKKNIQFVESKFTSIPLKKRGTITRLAKELGVSKSVVGRWVKSGVIKPHTSAIKPELSEQNITQRLNFYLSQIQPIRSHNTFPFSVMDNVIHIDEKWFYMTRESERYYIVPGELEPQRTCKSKRFITKVMFLCAVSRPRFSEDGNCEFDGKIGLWPLTRTVSAQRCSKNRPKGTLVTKPIDSITKEVIKYYLINVVVPAIKEKWPTSATRDIIIQQDNAKPHISNEDTDFRRVASGEGFNIVLVCQPPNSPDMNVNDLGRFREIQSLQVESSSYSVDELISNVLVFYENLTNITLNNVFLTLQSCLVEVMKAGGTNKYKIPHMGKNRLIREGRLPTTLQVEEELVKDNIVTLLKMGQVGGLKYNIRELMGSLWY